MTTALFIHEFRRTKGLLGVIVGGAATLVLLGTLLALTGWPVLSQAGAMVGFFAVFALLPVVVLALAIEYWRSAYGRFGYLTHTLPVAGSRIYVVRLAYGLVVSVVGTLVVALLALPLAVSVAALEAPPGVGPVAYLAEVARELWPQVPPIIVIAGVAFAVLMTWGYLVVYYFAASIGSGPRLGRLGAGGPIVAFFAVYIVLQMLPTLGLLAVPVGLQVTPEGVSLAPIDMWGAMTTGADLHAMPIGWLVPHVLAVIVLMVWTARAWDRSVCLR